MATKKPLKKENKKSIPSIRTDKGQKHEFVELPLPADTSLAKIFFPDQPNLRNVHAMRIKAYCAEVITTVPSGNTVIPYDLFQKGFLTLLLYNGKEFYHQVPLVEIFTYWGTNTGTFPFLNMQPNNMNYQKINWTKSYVEFPGADPLLEISSLPFSFYYCNVASVEEADASFEFNKKMK